MGKLAPSVLSADLLKLREQVTVVAENGADYIHVDVMDGSFVPNISFGPVMVSTLKRITTLPLDVHLMIQNPQNYIQNFADAGADIITVHQEACTHLDRVISQIKAAGCQAGVSLNPATPISSVMPILNEIDLLLIMSVNPGFGGQKFIPYTLEKIREAAEVKRRSGASFLIEVDGGISLQTVSAAVQAGAEVLVAGNAVFRQESPAEACKALKQVVQTSGRAV